MTELEQLKLKIEQEGRDAIFQIDRSNYGPNLFFTIKDVDTFDFLLEQGLNLHHTNYKNQNALFYNKNITILQKMLDAGLDVNSMDNQGNTPLGHALFAHTEPHGIEYVKFFMENGANINHKEAEGLPILFSGNIEKEYLDYLADYHLDKIDFTNIDYNQNRNLYYYTTHEVFLKKLHEHNMDINLVDNVTQQTAIFHLSTKKDLETFISYGANPFVVNEDKDNLLTTSTDYLEYEAIEYLIELGIDLNHRNKYGHNCLYYTSDEKKAKLIINSGLKIDEEFTESDFSPEIAQLIKNKIASDKALKEKSLLKKSIKNTEQISQNKDFKKRL